MKRLINVTAGKGGNAFLILGKEKTALLDTGMAYCAPKLVGNIKAVIDTRPLDYIFISHSHYDHIGAIPYIKDVWPGSKVLGAEYAQQILNSHTALKSIRKLSMQAAKIYADDEIDNYDDQLMKVDDVIRDGDCFDLGGATVKVMETPGHTKCSLSFWVNHETLFSSESTGYMSRPGKIYASFITSYTDAVASIHKCQKINPRDVISPHFGLVDNRESRDYWKNCLLAVNETKEFILRLSEQGYGEDLIFIEYEKAFRDDQSRSEQPIEAFRLNTARMIKTIRDLTKNQSKTG